VISRNGKALYVPGPSYFDPNVKQYAGWWNILEQQRLALEDAGYEVDTPQPPDELRADSPSFAKITAYGLAVAHMTQKTEYDVVLGAPSYGYIPMLAHDEAVRISYGWNNAPPHRNRVLEPEYARFGRTYDHSAIGDLLYNDGLWLSDLVICCSPYVSKTHAEVVNERRIGIAPWGVDSERFTPGEKNEDFTILFVGGDPIRKGFVYLLEAYSQLRHQGIKANLWAVGFKAQTKPDPDGFVRYFGMVPHEQMPAIYRQCHVLVCPTIEDGIACCVQEAMASGVVPITTEETAEVFSHPMFLPGSEPGGFEVPYQDSQAIWRVLDMLYWNGYPRWGKGRGLLAEKAVVSRQIAEHQTWARFRERFAELVQAAVTMTPTESGMLRRLLNA